MVKTDSNFKFPKRYKVAMASRRLNKETRNLWKKSFIEATVAVEEHRKAKIFVNKGEE